MTTTAEPTFLEPPVIDRLLDVIVAMGAELWAERERSWVLEQLLVQRGLLDADALEQFRRSAVQGAQRQAERDAYTRRIYGALASRMDDRTQE